MSKDFDMSPILKVLNEAHEKLMELTVPKKHKMKKREKALLELKDYIIDLRYTGYTEEFESGVDSFRTLALLKINRILDENEQNNK